MRIEFYAQDPAQDKWTIDQLKELLEIRKAGVLEELRKHRNQLLSASDWTQIPDAPLSDAQKQSWVKYRQALRDFPNKIDWTVDHVFTDGDFPMPPTNK